LSKITSKGPRAEVLLPVGDEFGEDGGLAEVEEAMFGSFDIFYFHNDFFALIILIYYYLQ
jgi:hypothetical protein